MPNAILIAAALLQSVSAQTAPPPAATAAPPTQVADPQTITVYGRRLEQRLAACLARACPPAEDMELSAQAAVFQFGAGRYGDARRTLRAAIGRNGRHADRYPGAVSSLHATLSTVQQHDGDVAGMVASARSSAGILATHIGRADPRTLAERLVLGDTLYRSRLPDAADGLYADVAADAAGAGQGRIAADAHLRRAWLALTRRAPGLAREQARLAVQASGDADVAVSQRIIGLRADVAGGDEAAVDRLAASLAAQGRIATPRLLSAPLYPNFARGAVGVIPNARDSNPGLAFADIGFFIREDGRVEDAAYLREGGLGAYREPLLRQVAGRRYTPFTAPGGEGGVYRIERVTVRGDMGTMTGSRIRRRLGDFRTRVEVADLTATNAMAEQGLATLRADEARRE